MQYHVVQPSIAHDFTITLFSNINIILLMCSTSPPYKQQVLVVHQHLFNICFRKSVLVFYPCFQRHQKFLSRDIVLLAFAISAKLTSPTLRTSIRVDIKEYGIRQNRISEIKSLRIDSRMKAKQYDQPCLQRLPMEHRLSPHLHNGMPRHLSFFHEDS